MVYYIVLLCFLLPVGIKSQDLICGVPGACEGDIIDIVANENLEECMQDCKSEPQCNWYSYLNLTDTCWLYTTCPLLDASIDEIVTFQKECDIYKCNAPGFCQGNLIGIEIAQSVQGCLKSCVAEDQCTWFSYELATKACYIFSSCSALDDSFGDFISGQRQCKVENSSKVIVFGGMRSNDPVVEVLDLNEASDQDQCSNVNITFPVQLYFGATGAIVSNTPLVCGGNYYDNNGTYTNNQGCYKLVNQSMTFIGNMSTTRNRAASIPVNNSLWVTGGIGRSTTEYVDLVNGVSKPGPDLPDGVRYQHCLIRTSNTSLVLAGGYGRKRTSFFFDQDLLEWSKGPELNSESPFGHDCKLMKKNKDLLLLLTGYDFSGADNIITTEILNLTQPNGQWKLISTWHTMSNSYHASLVTIADNSRAFLLGIRGSDGYNRDIYELTCQSETEFQGCEWTKTDKQLQVSRFNTKAAFVLPDESGIC